MTQYVLGFIFNSARDHVLLLKKNAPAWQHGRLNGIGGKVESGESPLAAMYREAYEEADLVNVEHTSWRHFATMSFGDDAVHCFTAQTESYGLLKEHGGPARTKTAEALVSVRTDAVFPQAYRMLSNIPWLVAMALDNNDGKPVVFNVKYDTQGAAHAQ